jgi:hypothetical protein
MRKRTILCGSLLVLTACGPYLRWKSAPSATSAAGKIAIIVEDKREPKKGGDDHRAIGVETGAFGIPDTVRLPSPDEAASALRGLVAQAALAAGVGVSPPGDTSATAKVVVELQTLWCTGYPPVYKAELSASVTIVDPATNAVRVVAMPLQGDDGSTGCRDAYQGALTQAFAAAQAIFAQAQVKAAATGADAPAVQ